MGRLFAVVGPSGAGKDTLLSGVCGPGGPYWARRVITRPEAAGGEPFKGVTEGEFARLLAAGEFALHWRAHGLAYGLPHAELAPRAQGRDVLFNGSRAVLSEAASVLADLQVILITAPPAVLAARLSARGREQPADIAARLTRRVDVPPAGLPVTVVDNSTTPAEGICRLRAALHPNGTR